MAEKNSKNVASRKSAVPKADAPAKKSASVRDSGVWKKLRQFYDKHTIRRIFLTIVAAALLIYVIVSIPAWTLKSEGRVSLR